MTPPYRAHSKDTNLNLNKTTWFSAITAVAVLGSMALPMVVSANEPADAPATERAAKPERKPERKPEKVRGNPLATALGITPEVLAAATKAAHATVPAMAPELKKNEAARKAHAAAIEAALAKQLGITVDALNVAQAKVKADTGAKSDERCAAADAKAKEHFAQVLTRLVGAGVITRTQADEIMTQYNLGGEAKETVLKRLRTLFQEEKAEQGFTQILKRLVGANILTQAQADEALARFNLGGDAKESVIKRIRALLQEKKDDGDKKRDEKRDDKKDEKRELKKPALERALKARPAGKPA